MEIKDINTENMTIDEINSIIKKLYQSKSQYLGVNGHNKVNILALSSMGAAFDKNGKYYEYLKIAFMNNLDIEEIKNIYIFFQKNNTDSTESIPWSKYELSYDSRINYGLNDRLELGKYATNTCYYIINYAE